MQTLFIIFLSIAGISLIVILAIVFRKFPQLSNVDLESLPEEKEARKKKEIVSRRVRVDSAKILGTLAAGVKPVGKVWGSLQLKFRIYVGKIERLWHHEERAHKKGVAVAAPAEDRELKINQLLQEAATYAQTGALDKAEANYISVISLNPKSIEAYRGLGDTYIAKGSVEEARETFLFLLKLAPADDGAYAKLAEIAEQQGNLDQAIEYYQNAVVLNDSLSPRFYHLAELLVKMRQPTVAKEAILSAVELEPKNPKYLDLLIEIGILCGDKDMAAKAFDELRLVNPKNQKLQVFQDRIKELV